MAKNGALGNEVAVLVESTFNVKSNVKSLWYCRI